MKSKLEDIRTVDQLRSTIASRSLYNNKIHKQIEQYEERIRILEQKIDKARRSFKDTAGLSGSLSMASQVNADAIAGIRDHNDRSWSSLVVRVNGKWFKIFWEQSEDPFKVPPHLKEVE